MRHSSTIAMAGFTAFLSVVLLMHLVNPELALASHYVSEYAIGKHGWLLNIAFIGNLIGSIALIIALCRAYPPPHRSELLSNVVDEEVIMRRSPWSLA